MPSHRNRPGPLWRQRQALALSPHVLGTATSPRLAQEAGCTAPQTIRPYLGKEKDRNGVNPPLPPLSPPILLGLYQTLEISPFQWKKNPDAIKITNNNNNKITIGLFSKQTKHLAYVQKCFLWKTLSASLKKNSQSCPGRTWFCVADMVERPKMNSERNVTL